MKIITSDSFDLNNDGRPDRLTAPVSTNDDPVSDEDASRYLKPEISLRSITERMGFAPHGFSDNDGKFYFTPHFFSFTKSQPDARFYAANGLASFVAGQRAGVLNDKNEMTDVMDIQGVAISVVRSPPFNGLVVYTPHYDHPKRVRHWAYSVDSQTGEVMRKEDTSGLCWAITHAGMPERLDPNRVANTDGIVGLTDSEKMIKTLFDEAKKIHVEKPNDKQKKELVGKLKKLAKTWERNHALSNPLAKEIHDPKLWQGILGAMAVLSGLAPADFPG
jgi:hypothetical protein